MKTIQELETRKNELMEECPRTHKQEKKMIERSYVVLLGVCEGKTFEELATKYNTTKQRIRSYYEWGMAKY